MLRNTIALGFSRRGKNLERFFELAGLLHRKISRLSCFALIDLKTA